MQIDPEKTPSAAYKVLIGCVVPRPIAWVSSMSPDGVLNLAPFSFFNAVCSNPPTVMFSAGSREGVAKDTVQNVKSSGEYVINVVNEELVEPMNLSSGEYPSEVDEFALTGLTSVPSVKVGAPRVAEAPISMECRLSQVIPVGREGYYMVLGEVVHFHIKDEIYDQATGRIDMLKLNPIGRLAGNWYARVNDIFELARPNPNYRG
jgi:flavin reductase (DIM6/NTAB) family NADH-FMN oxidoreductase RutF